MKETRINTFTKSKLPVLNIQFELWYEVKNTENLKEDDRTEWLVSDYDPNIASACPSFEEALQEAANISKDLFKDNRVYIVLAPVINVEEVDENNEEYEFSSTTASIIAEINPDNTLTIDTKFAKDNNFDFLEDTLEQVRIN